MLAIDGMRTSYWTIRPARGCLSSSTSVCKWKGNEGGRKSGFIFGCPEADKCVISHVYCHVEEEGFFVGMQRE